MRRYSMLGALLIAILAPASALGSTAARVAAGPSASHGVQLVAFHFGRSRGFGGGGLFSRRRPRTHILRRVAHALAFAYVLHLLFSHGGISILFWLIVIGLVVHLVRRRRRTRFSY